MKSLGKTTKLNKGRVFNSGKVLLVLFCEIHFWVSCFLYSIEISFYEVFGKLGHQGKKAKTCFYFKLSSFLTTDPCGSFTYGSDVIVNSVLLSYVGNSLHCLKKSI